MTHAAVYLRISQDPTGEAAGVTRQREDCLKLVENQGWDLFEVYQDNDISASSGRTRPEYVRMLKDVAAGNIDAIVAWHPDRLYRKLRDLEGLLDAIEKQNVIMRTVRAGEIDLSTPTGRMLARILSATAQAEGEIKADRWSRSWRQGREAGNVARTGTRLFGYTRDGEVIPHEAKITQRMVDWFTAGVSILEIARRLQQDGILTTRGSQWRTGTIRQYLQQPRLAGWSTLNGEIVGEGKWEPIIDRETWETVRGMLAARTRDKPPRVALLAGIIRCGKCGHKLITGNARGKRSYRCPSRRPGLDGCGGTSAYAQPIEEVVETYAKARLTDPAVLARIGQLRSVGGAGELLAEATGLEARLLELEASLDEPGVPVASITRAMSRTRERLADVQSKLAEAATHAPAVAYTGGSPWPDDLARRRQLVTVALGDQTVFLDPVKDRARHSTWDPSRVRISPSENA